MTGGYVFTRICQLTPPGGVPPSSWWMGVPHLADKGVPPSSQWGYPHPSWQGVLVSLQVGGTPSSWWGYPHLANKGYLWYPPGWDWMRVLPPPHQDWMRVPPVKTGWGYPHPIRTGWGYLLSPPPPSEDSSSASTCYTADGMPLAFTQEDFLGFFKVTCEQHQRTAFKSFLHSMINSDFNGTCE